MHTISKSMAITERQRHIDIGCSLSTESDKHVCFSNMA